MDCNELVELITDYLEGRLSVEEHERFEEHLEECLYCRIYLDQMRQVIRTVGKLREKHIAPEARQQLLGVFRNWTRGV